MPDWSAKSARTPSTMMAGATASRARVIGTAFAFHPRRAPRERSAPQRASDMTPDIAPRRSPS